MKKEWESINHLLHVVVATPVEHISSDPCARRRLGMALRISQIFLTPLLHQNRAECTCEAEDETEGPQRLHDDRKWAGTKGLDVEKGRRVDLAGDLEVDLIE